MELTKDKTGWNYAYNETRQHFFINGLSLCKKVALPFASMDSFLDVQYPGLKPCAACKKKIEQLINQIREQENGRTE